MFFYELIECKIVAVKKEQVCLSEEDNFKRLRKEFEEMQFVLKEIWEDLSLLILEMMFSISGEEQFEEVV